MNAASGAPAPSASAAATAAAADGAATPGSPASQQASAQPGLSPGEAGLLNALVELTRQAGRPVSAAALRAQATLDPQGNIRFESLQAALDGAGMDLHRHEGPLGRLTPLDFPAIAALADESFVIVRNAAEATALQEGRPVDGAVRAAYDDWSLSVALRPTSDRRSEIPGHRDARAWFWQVLWELRPYYFHVVLATLVANVLSLAVSLFTMNVYDRVVPNRTYETLWVLAIGTSVALLFDFLARTLRGWLLDTAGKRADLQISSALFRRMLEMKLIQKPASSGSFVSNLRDFESVRDVLTSATLTALIDLPFFLLFVAVIFSIAPVLAVIPVVCIVIVVLAGALAQRPLARLIRDSMKESSQRQGLAVEAVEGLETLKTNNALAFVQQRWEWYTEKIAVTSAESRHLSSMVINFTSTVQQLATVATVVAGVYLIHDGALSMGGLIGVVILCGRAIAPLGQLAGLAVRIQQARSAFSGLQAMMDKEIEREPDRSYLTLPAARGEIAMTNIDFSHDPKGVGLFRGLSLKIQAGERVAILGRTGSGKSTLLRLAAGLYSPSSGQVTIDGLDVRQVDPADLRNAIGLLPQDARLFLGTLRENLDMAVRDRNSDDARMIDVLKMCGLDQFISQHPRGMDMLLGEDGLGLSGGQKRLVALARVALRDPAVVLLDEPTSSLDPSSEVAILRALDRWRVSSAQPKTMVIVTHRPQVLEIVDRVIIVEQGRIVLDGPKAQVLAQLNRGVTIPLDPAGAPAAAMPGGRPSGAPPAPTMAAPRAAPPNGAPGASVGAGAGTQAGPPAHVPAAPPRVTVTAMPAGAAASGTTAAAAAAPGASAPATPVRITSIETVSAPRPGTSS